MSRVGFELQHRSVADAVQLTDLAKTGQVKINQSFDVGKQEQKIFPNYTSPISDAFDLTRQPSNNSNASCLKNCKSAAFLRL